MNDLTILKHRVQYTRNKKWKHLFKCFCGKEFIAIGADVNSKKTRSCGCLSSEAASKRMTTHGMSSTVEYTCWIEMKRRCLNKRCLRYKDYGARGITICKRWLDSFESFYHDMGKKTSLSHSIDRINNNGNYEPGNCRWATRTEQKLNTRRSKKYKNE